MGAADIGMREGPRRLDSLTSLRFFAALAVVLDHAGQYFPAMPGGLTVFDFGYTGVSFFFVLSGCVLVWSRPAKDTAPRFYWRRFARVWPLHALTTLLAVPLLLFEGRDINWVALPAVLLLVHAWIPIQDWYFSFDGPSWSLSCEAFFYGLFPLLFPVAMRAGRRGATLLAAAIAVGMSAVALSIAILLPNNGLVWLLFVNPAFRLGEFAIGMLIGAALLSGWRLRMRLGLLVPMLAVAYLALVLAQRWGHPARQFVGDLVLLPLLAVLLAAAASADLDGRTVRLGRPLLVRLGEWSFALYLVHTLVMRTAFRILPAYFDSVTATVMAAASIAVSIAISALLYHVFERPVERRLRRLGHVRQRQTSRLPGEARPTGQRTG